MNINQLYNFLNKNFTYQESEYVNQKGEHEIFYFYQSKSFTHMEIGRGETPCDVYESIKSMAFKITEWFSEASDEWLIDCINKYFCQIDDILNENKITTEIKYRKTT